MTVTDTERATKHITLPPSAVAILLKWASEFQIAEGKHVSYGEAIKRVDKEREGDDDRQ